MSVRTAVFPTEHELARYMNQQGLSVDAVSGPYTNATGHLFIFFDGPAVPLPNGALPAPATGAGMSYGTIAGVGTVVMMALSAPITGEVVGAISAGLASGPLAQGYVLPGTVVLTDSGGVGPTMVDNGQGILVEKGTTKRRGTINYTTKVVSISYTASNPGTGNLEADYSWSTVPDAADVPEVCKLTQIAVSGAGGNIAFAIYEDEALTTPAVTGTIVVSGGVGFLPLDYISRILETDPTKRNRRWITVDGACTVHLYWSPAV